MSHVPRSLIVPLPVRYSSLISSGEFRICPPVGKSGPLMYLHSCALPSSAFSSSRMSAVHTSPRLCGGILVAIPTAMPVAPLIIRFGSCAGSTTGSVLVPS